jgi:hypothetical protein
MGQPNGAPVPPGNTPLVDGLDSSWNEIVGAFPEDKRAELAPKIRDRIKDYEPLRAYEDFAKSNISSDHINAALSVYSFIENNPHEVYQMLGDSLGISRQQAQQLTQQAQQSTDGEEGGTGSQEIQDDPRLTKLQEQYELLARTMVAQYQQQQQMTAEQEEDAQLEQELTDLKKKYGGNINEREIIRRMMTDDVSAEEAYTDYMNLVTEIQKRRPAPFVMGSGSMVPREQVDVRKLDRDQTKNFVAQMIQQQLAEGR